jgi:hypothetical protein
MLHLTRVIDRATGCVFMPPPNTPLPPDAVRDESTANTPQAPNAYGLLSSSFAPLKGPMNDPRDVQERWIDEREAYDAFERAQWSKEADIVRAEEAQKREET